MEASGNGDAQSKILGHTQSRRWRLARRGGYASVYLMYLDSSTLPKLDPQMKVLVNGGQLGLYTVAGSRPDACFLLHSPPDEYYLLNRQGEFIESLATLPDSDVGEAIIFSDIDVSLGIRPNYG